MPKRRRLIIAAVGVLSLVLAGAFAWRHFKAGMLVDIGVGYTSHLTCACLFISGRPLESCKQDLDPLARKLISVSVSDREVTARSFGLARATARFHPTFGCAVLP